MKISSLVLRKRPYQILLAVKRLGEPSLSQISREVGCAFAYTGKMVEKMKELGLVSFTREGRVKRVKLTERGSRLTSLLSKIEKLG